MKQRIQQFCRKILMVHISRTWDGKNKSSLKSHDANIILFDYVRLQPMWRSFDNDKIYVNLYVGIINKTGHHQIFSLTVYPYFEFRTPWSRRLWKRTINYFTIRRLEREVEELEEICHNICSDEMCGCPEDFAESYGRQIRQLEWQIHGLSY